MPTRPRFTPQIQTAGQSNLSVYVRCPDFPQNIESAAAVCSLIFIDLQRQGNRGRINLLRGTLYRTNDLLSLCVFFFFYFWANDWPLALPVFASMLRDLPGALGK
jgi:hypothetical protein